MEETTIGAVLFDGIEKNPYLNELYDAILYNYGRQLFGLTNLPEKEISVPAALRFADILSKSVHTQNEETHKLWAQEIVALLNALHPDDELIQYYLGSVLTSVSNYRGVSLKAADYVSADLLDRIFTQVSKEYLRIPEAENEYFFRAQKEIYEKFNEPYFSYSAPTSLGKSYIMRTFIREQIAKGRQCNFAIIVPTKALINETTDKLTEVLGPELKEKNYRIVTSAGAMALEEEHNFIFAMTPERLLYLLILMKDIPIEYLFIDEAHKISKEDGRSAFYYKVVDMLSQRSTPPHIIFASPNIPNPEVYLQLIPDVANRENYKIATKFSPVNQEKFLIDFKRFELHYYNEATQKLTKYCGFPEGKELLDFVHELGEGARSIVYSNSKDNVVEYALQYAAQLQPLHDSDLDVLAQDIRQDVHGNYYLADIVEKGVAYHMGYLPSTIRVRIEALYKAGKITALFCTSTLLEGVNLPADNLFITSHKNGGDMSPVDFRNLMGRVGRIEFNLYGNVFLVCIKRKTKKERFLNLLQEKIVPQQLSLATALTPEQKTNIVSVLKSGQAEIPKDGSLPPAEYQVDGKPHFVYSWRLEPTDPQPVGKKPCLSLRELEKQIGYDLDSKLDPLGKNITVEELINRYLATKTGIKPNTLMNYNFVRNLMKNEPFSRKKISEVKVSDAKLFLIKLQQDGKGYSTVKTVRGVLRPAFQMAVDDDLIIKNPFGFQLAGVVVNDSVTREAIKPDQMRKFLKFVHDDNVYCKYYEVVFILFHTGMRISEFCGLTIRDLDMENRIINIDHQLQRTGMKIHIESTKTNAGTRKIPMTEDVYRCFQGILEDREPSTVEKIVDGYSGFLFLDKEGLPEVAMHWEHRFNHMVKRYNEIYRVQLPNITPHVCRHTYCSNMARAGMNPKTLQYLMGHSDIGVTMNTYTHLGLEDAQNEMIRLEELNRAKEEVAKAAGEQRPVTQKSFRAV